MNCVPVEINGKVSSYSFIQFLAFYQSIKLCFKLGPVFSVSYELLTLIRRDLARSHEFVIHATSAGLLHTFDTH